jgi:acylphosphatase
LTDRDEPKAGNVRSATACRTPLPYGGRIVGLLVFVKQCHATDSLDAHVLVLYTGFMTVQADKSRERRIVHYRGRVQGVGFRFTTRELASQFDVTGYVQNLHDGQVLVVAEGEPKELDGFLARIQAVMGSYIRGAGAVTTAPSGEFQGFDVQF